VSKTAGSAMAHGQLFPTTHQIVARCGRRKLLKEL
jgi:hypothetical protein